MSRHPRLTALFLGFWIFSGPTASAQFSSVRVQVIDRGQADGILIRTPNSKWVVIDAGDDDDRQAEAMQNAWGVDRLALVITSHRHGDHYGGMDRILTRFPVDLNVANLADCPNRITDDTIRSTLATRKIPTHGPGHDTITVDGVDFEILPPDPVDDPCPGDENDNSVLVRMTFGEFSMLFAGDAEQREEREWFMQNHPDLLDVDVLKAAHHGSFNGANGTVDGKTRIDFVSPDDVVISALAASPFGHPHDSAMTAHESAVGADHIHCTSRHGTVRVYGCADGHHRIFHQFESTESCRFANWRPDGW